MLDEILDKRKLSDTHLKIFVPRIVVHRNNEDKSFDVRLDFDGDFEDGVAV